MGVPVFFSQYPCTWSGDAVGVERFLDFGPPSVVLLLAVLNRT